MTYRELLDELRALSPEQLDTEIQYQDTNTGELMGVRGLGRMGDHSEDESDDNPILDILQ
jgi:hypothetical protein